jgi:cation:H+ antiporter
MPMCDRSPGGENGHRPRRLAVAVLVLVLGFAGILAGAFLFTNAVEWAGSRIGLGIGAVGTLLAGVSTAVPESAIPVLAILRGDPDADEVAVGAIIGAPFMLATVAMALVGLTALGYAKRREQGRALDVHRPTLRRDLLFFLAAFTAAVALGVGISAVFSVVAALLFLVAYGGYVVVTVRRGGRTQAEHELDPLIADTTKKDPPANWMIAVQFLLGLGLIIGGAHLVVEQLLAIAELLDVSPLVLALLIAPLATELPEKANSFLWVRDGKDALALGNLTGAMVFQSTIPVAVGVAFTSWQLDGFAFLAGVIAIAGGLVAYWSLERRRRFAASAIFAWSGLFATFAASVVLFG